MEQTNLVVTSDGKTWDEVTRDTSYLGPSTIVYSQYGDSTATSTNNPLIFSETRGNTGANYSHNKIEKNIAHAYDRYIILIDGWYDVSIRFYTGSADANVYVSFNNTSTASTSDTMNVRNDPADNSKFNTTRYQCKRGDYFYIHAAGASVMTGATYLTIQKVN